MPKTKVLSLLERAAGGGAELIALERRSGALVEEVRSVECVVAEKFVDRAVKLIGAGLRDDDDLAAGMLAEFGAVVVALHVEFAHGVDAEQLAAGPAGLHVVFGGAGEFDAVEQKKILLRAIAETAKLLAVVELEMPVPPVFCEVKLTMPGFSVRSRS